MSTESGRPGSWQPTQRPRGRPLAVPLALRHLTRDTWLLFATRFIRLFAYGSLSVVLVFYLVSIGLSERQAGLLLTLTLFGDTAISLAITTRADRMGRRGMLIVGALLMTAAGLVFASTDISGYSCLQGQSALSARAATRWGRSCRLSKPLSLTW